MKQHISLREANQHLSRYIDAVEHGDEIIITRRSKPVGGKTRVFCGRKNRFCGTRKNLAAA